MADAKKEKIAIVGCGVKVPGADTLEEYWNLLEKGENHVIEIPKERWNHEAYYDKDRHAVGKTYASRAGLLKDPLAFDNEFFNIPNVEADQMDPQQRYVLECVYRAMEDGGITMEEVRGKKVGVYVGAMNTDYKSQFNSMSSVLSNYTVTGVSNSVIAARVSYVFDFRGPSMTIGTACSSALVAAHLGVQALRAGDCDIAICGGTNFMHSPDVFIHLAKANMASEGGQCFTFSDRADGYTRGEGCAMVILKRLSDETNKERIWATLETGCNQDGRTKMPLPAPSEEQQHKLLQETYAATNIDPNTIQYIEAHGTGTPRGDPSEINALGKFFCSENLKKSRFIGSVKTNIGHLESAAGTAGLIKVLLMMKYSKIVPSLFFDNPNPNIKFEEMNFIVPTKVEEWKDRKKVACINCFGFGGTNSHAVIHSYDSQACMQDPAINMATSYMVCFSGKTLRSVKGSIEDFLSYPQVETVNIRDVSYTSTVSRDHHRYRQAFVVKSVKELLECLKQHVRASLLSPENFRAPKQQHHYFIFVFCGMGSEWVGMGKDMLRSSTVFREAVKEIDHILNGLVDWSLEDRLQSETDQQDLDFWPFAIFACQIGLAKLWESLGVFPNCVVGNSMGEVAAAYVAGILSLKDAVKVIYARTKVLTDLASNGRMIVVKNMPLPETKTVVHGFSGYAEVSVEISPVCCAVSAGSELTVSKLREALSEKAKSRSHEVYIIDLHVSVGYHSPCVDPCKEKLAQMLHDILPTKPKIDMISTVTGELVQDSQNDLLDKAYWVRNMRESVKFCDAVQKSWKKDCDNIYIEVGPKPFMGPHVRDIFPESDMKTIPSMVKESGLDSFLKATSLVYEHGCNLKWQNIPGAQEGHETTPIPRYCFQPTRKLDVSESAYVLLSGINYWRSHHPFVFKATNNSEYKLILSEMTFPSVYDHRFFSEIIVPGALYTEVGFAVAKHLFQTKVPLCSVSVTLTNPCRLESGKPGFLDIFVKKAESNNEDHSQFDLAVMRGDKTFANIKLLTQRKMEKPCGIDISEILTRCPTHIDKDNIYKLLAKFGFSYGPSLLLLKGAQTSERECLTQMDIPNSLLPEMLETTLHPSIVDAMVQTCAVIQSQEETEKKIVLPVSIGQIKSLQSFKDEMFIHSNQKRSMGNLSVFDVKLVTKWGETLVEMEDLAFKTLTESQTEEIVDFAKCNWMPSVMKYKDKLDMEVNSNCCVRYGANGESISSIPEVLTEKADTSSGQDFIVLHGDISIDDSDECFGVQSKILDVCKLLREVFAHNFKKRIYMFTKWGISITDTPSCAENINPIMTALWGFTRCALIENVAEIVILDLHLSEDTCSSQFLTSLAHFIHSNDSLSSIMQWVVTEEALLIHQVIPQQRETEIIPNFKEVFAEKSRNMVMISKEINSFNLYHENHNLDNHVSRNVTTMDITESGLLNREFFNVSVPVDQIQPNWQEQMRGNALFAVERIGNVHGETDDEIVSCYPFITCTRFTVPTEATLKKRLFNSYSLGDLSRLVVLYSLCKSVVEDSVTIIASPSSEGLGTILKLMCEADSRATDVNLIKAGDIQSERALKKTIISLVRLKTQTVVQMAAKWCEARMLVTVAPLIQNEARALLRYLLPSVEIMEQSGDSIFRHSNIIDVVPWICKWMQSNASVKCDISKSLLETHDTPLKHHDALEDVADLLKMTKVEFDTSQVCVTPAQMFHKQAVYIVVGGLTGLGWMFVEFLAKHGAGNIAIMNRREASESNKIAMATLCKENDCTIESFQADVINPNVLEECMALIKETFVNKPIRGVFFGAAVLKDQLFSQINWNDFENVISAKVMGSWNMHQLTKDQDLDYFVLQSSVASVFGNHGQSSYAAGNAFMDGLAHYRRHKLLAGQSINWGPLDTGMLKRTREGAKQVLKALTSLGILLLKKEEIFASIIPTLLLNKVQPTQCKLNFKKVKISRLNVDPNSQSNEIQLDPKLRHQLQHAHSLSEQDRVNVYERFITFLVSQMLGEREHEIQSESNLYDLGMDSLLALRVQGEIKGRLGCDLNFIVLLGDPVPRAIAEKINEMLHGQDEEPEKKKRKNK